MKEKILTGYYTIDSLSEALEIKGDILTPTGKIITREEQSIEELKAYGYQFLYFDDDAGKSFIIVVTAPKNIKYDKSRKYVVKDPLNLTDAKYNFLKETVTSYETKTAKYNCRRTHSKRMKMYTRSGYFLKEFLDAVSAFKDDVSFAIAEYHGGK